MRVVFINPNSTESMTKTVVSQARRAAPGLEIEGWTSREGPASIEGRADGDAAVPPLLRLVEKAGREGAGCIVIACFDDTGLDAARGLVTCPVIGIGQAAYHAAAMLGGRFSVLTTMAVSVPILEENIESYGLSGALGKVRATGIPVLAIEEDPEAATAALVAGTKAAQAEDGARCIALGCAGMAHLTARIRRETGCLVVDGVEAAARMAALAG
jgi:allantoin racemase